MRAMARWIRADLRASTARAVVVAAMAAGVVTALLLSAGLLQGATNPWQGLFTATKGAQIWLHLSPGTDVRKLPSQVGGIQAVAGPYPATAATVAAGGQRTRVELRAMGPRLPSLGRPLLVSGHWLAAGSLTGVVLEATFAQAIHASAGGTLMLDNVDETARVRVRVIGIAQTADQGFYPDQTPGLIWVLPGLLRQLEPNAGHTEEVVGLRIANPAATSLVVQQVVTQLGSSAVGTVSTWQQVQQSMARRDPLLGLLLALFGLMALGAAVLAIVNVTSGRVLLQTADLGMLQTLGFTPVQVMTMLTAEHALLAACGIAAGLLAARLLMPALLGGVPGVSAAAATVPGGWAAVIVVGCFGAVLLATAAPAWQAGRVRPIAAVRTVPPRGHLSRIASIAMAARTPPALVLGARSAFVRRLPALLAICGLAIPMMMITIGLGFWSTLDEVQRHPADIGLAAQVTVSSGPLTTAQTLRLIHSDPQVLRAYTCVLGEALVPGETTTITTLGMGTSRQPYPFHVVQGRLYHAPEQAVATAALLSALRLKVGQFVRMWFGGVPVTFHIVGRIIDPQYGGQLLAYGRDTLADEGAAAPIGFYSLILRPGVSPRGAVAALMRASGRRLSVAQVPNPADQLGIVRGAVAALIAVLAVIGLTSLLTTSLLGYRDQLRDVSVLQAMGLTPRQVRAALMTRTTVLALIAVGIGTVVGRL
ncbi:MAG TPA: FtsX-like permease family protein, partial [Streptosporangiaceae bacterium]|nr:FtsX-like permease family protein [Streptosporangiaceae bacterium]